MSKKEKKEKRRRERKIARSWNNVMAKRSWQMNTTHFPCASINEKALSHFITCHCQHEGMNLYSDKNSAFSLGLRCITYQNMLLFFANKFGSLSNLLYRKNFLWCLIHIINYNDKNKKWLYLYIFYISLINFFYFLLVCCIDLHLWINLFKYFSNLEKAHEVIGRFNAWNFIE